MTVLIVVAIILAVMALFLGITFLIGGRDSFLKMEHIMNRPLFTRITLRGTLTTISIIFIGR